jgi:hypothetical protein
MAWQGWKSQATVLSSGKAGLVQKNYTKGNDHGTGSN